MALQCDIQLLISAVKDFRFLIQQTIAEARKVRIQAANYGLIVSCCNKTRSVDSKHPYKERNNNNNRSNKIIVSRLNADFSCLGNSLLDQESEILHRRDW